MAKKATPHHVRIRAQANGNFSYVNGLILASRGEQVRWSCNHPNFTISFSEGTPFDRLQFESTSGEIEAQAIRDDAELKEYHYKVAVAVQLPTARGAIKILLNGGCPEVQVGS